MALVPGWLADLLGVRAAVDGANVEYPQRRLWRFIGGVTIADNPILGTTDISAGGSLGFRGEFYVDPTFTGHELGSSSSPFRTFAACFAYAASIGVVHGKIYTNSVTENVVLPATGDWEIAGIVSLGNIAVTTITGNVDCSATGAARRTFTNLRISGTLTGNASAGAQSLRVLLDCAAVVTGVNLTVSGGGLVRLGVRGGVPGSAIPISNMGYSLLIGPVSVQGTVWASTAQFGSSLSCSGRCTFSNCVFTAGTAITTTADAADDNSLFFHSSYVSGVTINVSQTVAGRLALVSAIASNFDASAVNFSGVGINIYGLDAVSAQTLNQHGATLTGTVVNGAGVMARARQTGRTGNIAPTAIAFKGPIAMMRMNATLTLATPGTAGSAVLNAVYTDSLGVTRTKPVTPALNIAGSSGDEAQGSLLFTQDGTGDFRWSVTGIVTPGALSYNVAVSLEPAT